MMKWQQRYRIEWDATDGRNGGAQRTVWEMLMDMERFKYRVGTRRFGSGGLGSGPGEGLRAGQPSCAVGVGDALQLPKEDLASAVRVLRASEAVRRMRGGPDHHGYLARVKAELLALSEVTRIYFPLKLIVFVDDITALLIGENKEVAVMAKKVMTSNQRC